jgi:hypothetical protein
MRKGRWVSSSLFLFAACCLFLHAEPAHASRDLQVESIHIRPRMGEDEKVEFWASVRNNGSESATEVNLQLDVMQKKKRVKAIKDIPVLSRLPRSGTGQSIPVYILLKPGSYDAVIVVDPENKIEETNETNNQKTVSFTVS